MVVVGIYVLLHFFIFEEDPIQIFIWNSFESYQYFIEGIADFYLWFFGTGIAIVDHTPYFDGLAYQAIENGMLLKKWTILLLVLFWLTPTKVKSKLTFTFILILILLIFLPIGFAINANYSLYDNELIAAYRVGRGLPILAFVTLLLLWIKKNAPFFLGLLKHIPFLYEIYLSKKKSIILLLYFSLILKTFITGAFAFEAWVNLIFNISQFFINLLGYDVHVQPFYLYGHNIVIFMNKSCLGFMTMLVFASVVWLTGRNDKTTWFYIFFGFIILNIANVIRFVLLYIYLYKHGEYLLSIDIHDIYTAGIYLIVLLLWLLWFEKYSNLNNKASKKLQ